MDNETKRNITGQQLLDEINQMKEKPTIIIQPPAIPKDWVINTLQETLLDLRTEIHRRNTSLHYHNRYIHELEVENEHLKRRVAELERVIANS